jgi:hypothetical protein
MNTLNRLWVTCSTRLFLIFVLVAAIFMVSCAGTGNYGQFVYNDNVNKAFETYQLPPNHTYYYNGPNAFPRAVIGIRNEYHLESKFWKPVDLTQTLLKRWLEMGSRSKHTYSLNRRGSDLLTPDGRPIGIWYAVRNWRDRATVKMIDDKTVNVSHPFETNPEKKKGGGR